MWRPCLSQRPSNYESSDQRTVFHFASFHFEQASAKRRCCYFWIMLIWDSWVNAVISTAFIVVQTDGSKITGIQNRFLALSLAHKDLSRFSELFDYIMICRWWDIQSLCIGFCKCQKRQWSKEPDKLTTSKESTQINIYRNVTIIQ